MRGIFAPTSNLVFMAQCFRFGWRRCSPLNWALGVLHSQFGFIFVDAFSLIMYKSF